MKLKKSRLREIIREEIQKLNEGLPWERGLDENWFSDMKAKAQQAYIKANPTSKYAKGVKSGDKEAPMTGKERGVHDKETAKKEKDQKQEKIKSGNRKWASKQLSDQSRDGQFNPKDMTSDDPNARKEAIADFSSAMSDIYREGDDNYPDWQGNAGITNPELFNDLLSNGKATPKAMKLINNIASNEDAYEADYDALYKELQGIKRGGLVGGTYAGALGAPPAVLKKQKKATAIRKAKEKKADAAKAKDKEKDSSSSSKSSDFADTFRKIGTGSAF